MRRFHHRRQRYMGRYLRLLLAASRQRENQHEQRGELNDGQRIPAMRAHGIIIWSGIETVNESLRKPHLVGNTK